MAIMHEVLLTKERRSPALEEMHRPQKKNANNDASDDTDNYSQQQALATKQTNK